MQRYNFYFNQFLASGDQNALQDGIEQAIWNQFADRQFCGIISGFYPTAPGSGWNLTIAPGFGIDKNGARLYSGSPIVLDPRTDSASVSTVPASGHRGWVSIYAHFGRNPSDARTDGLGNPIKYNQAEALNPISPYNVAANAGKLLVVGGVTDLTTNPLPARPAPNASAILLCDILITAGDTGLVDAKIDSSRAERLASEKSLWLLPSASQYNGSDDKYVLVSSHPVGTGGGFFARTYASTRGLVHTINAAWDPVAEVWTADTSAAHASRTIFETEGLSIDRRNTTSTTWLDVTGATGWDDNMSMDANGEIIGSGTTTTLFVYQGAVTDPNKTVTTTMTFRRKLAATPSSVTYATWGGHGDLNIFTGGGGVSTGIVTAEAIAVECTAAATGDMFATRQITTVV